MKLYKAKISFYHYLPLFFLLCFSGNPLITSISSFKLLISVYTLLFVTDTVAKWKLKQKELHFIRMFVSIIALIALLQKLFLGFVSYDGMIRYILYVLLGMFTILYYKRRKISFFDIYIKIMAFLALVSIPFFIFNQFGTYGIELPNRGKSLFFYTFLENSQLDFMIRNSGMFWEPGAFSGYLILGLIFVVWKNKAFKIGQYKKEVFLIIIGIITAVSTTGYIVFALMFLLYALSNFKKGKILVVPAVLFIVVWSYNNIPNMEQKIEGQYMAAMSMQEKEVSNTRFGQFFFDLLYIKASPIFGNGLDNRTRYRFHPNLEMKGFGNGMTDFVADWGIPLFLFWLFCIFKFVRKRTDSKRVAWFSLLLIGLLLQGESYLNYPLFLSFFCLPYVYYYERRRTKQEKGEFKIQQLAGSKNKI